MNTQQVIIIAECGHNHQGDMNIMKDMIRQAKDCGADVAKFQLYDTDKIIKTDHKFYWDLKRGELTKGQWMECVSECNAVGIEFFASVFDLERFQWAEEAGMPRYKIASRSIYDKDLLEAIAGTKKNMIISLGKKDERGIPKINSGSKIDYLYCVAKYPAPLTDMKLGQADFNVYSGISDHTAGIEACMVALSRGARIIEKHFTFDKEWDGCDHAGSMTPDELKRLVDFKQKCEFIL